MDLRPSALVVNRTFTGSFVYLPLSPSITSNFVTATKVTQFPVFIAKMSNKIAAKISYLIKRKESKVIL